MSWVHGGPADCVWSPRPYGSLEASLRGWWAPLVPAGFRGRIGGRVITEHYWGYTKQRGGGTSEYRVDHPSWLVWDALESSYESPPTETLYGPKFSEVLGAEPKSAFVAVGSEVSVFLRLIP